MNSKKSQTPIPTFLRTLRFSEDEMDLIKKAKTIKQVSMPSLYHDCIMASVMQIVRKEQHGA